jgi:alcohol dehydrogenase
VQRILAEIGFPTLGSVGVAEADVDALADAALQDYFITLAPAPWSKQDVVDCYRTALAVTERGS